MLNHDYPKSIELKDGRKVILRPLAQDDFDGLFSFFQALSKEDRLYLAHDVSDPDLVRKWTDELDFERVIPLVALERDRIVGNGTLRMASRGWMRHVGQIRLVTARSHRHRGLGAFITRDLVALAGERGLQKLQAHVIEDSVGAVRMFEAVGFNKVAVVEKLVRDQHGAERNLAIMINDVVSLAQIMEDWIQDMMIPAFRGPGEGSY
ncbi:MAG: GNAT family N-acetyltransferase [bacterium]|nr:GNAT family N-acetyltransferase [bacterium]